MANFLTCKNGHNYDAEQNSVCPYCPVISNDPNYKKTLNDFKNTQVFSESQEFSKTLANEDAGDFLTTRVIDEITGSQSLRQTQIAKDQNPGAAAPSPQLEKRKLVGWLVTFNNDQYGQDYKLYSGKNKIGSAPGCDIIIYDPSVSGEHTTIFYRENEFLIKDNFSTNGTIVNGKSVTDGKIKEGDMLRLGNTVLKFKTVF